jgi:hypothetical protein
VFLRSKFCKVGLQIHVFRAIGMLVLRRNPAADKSAAYAQGNPLGGLRPQNRVFLSKNNLQRRFPDA